MRRKKFEEAWIELHDYLHKCENCKGCKYYSLEGSGMGKGAYCVYPDNWEMQDISTTELKPGYHETHKIPVCDKGPDEINFDNNCSWKIVDGSSRDE